MSGALEREGKEGISACTKDESSNSFSTMLGEKVFVTGRAVGA